VRTKLGFLLACLAALAAPPLGAQQVSSRVVAYSGMPAPGASPATFDNFNYPVIAPRGEIVFRGRLVTGSNTYGLWRERLDQTTTARVLSLVQREGQASPVAGFNFAGFPGPPTIGLPGSFAFKSHIQSGATFHDTLWVEKLAPAGLTLVAREGSPAPGVPGVNFGIIFSHAGYDPLLLDDNGRALFVGRLTGGGVTTGNDTGIWFYDGTTTNLVAREGDQMPGLPAGHFFADTFLTSNFVLLGNGVFVFFGSDGDPVTPIRGLWSSHSGTVQPLILEGGSAPGLAGNEKLVLIGSFRINGNNQVALSGLVERNDGVNPVVVFKAVWISDAQGTFFLSARSDQAPDGRVPHVQVLTDGGHAFGVDELGRLGRVTWGGLSIISKPGDPAPGAGAGVVLASIDPTAIAANSAGQVAFTAPVTGPGVSLANDRGLWAQDGSFGLVLVAREGNSIEAPAGSPRTITGIEFALGAGSGQPRAMSDRGEVLWKAQVAGLPNGSQVVAVTGVGSPPAPPELMALEVVQVIQNWKNEIPLVEGKKTVVRALLKRGPAGRFTARLRGFAGSVSGTELPGSPLSPANPGGYVNIDSTSDQKRTRLGAGLYFELPESWTTGTVTLVPESAEPLICREAALPVGNDCRSTVTFRQVEAPRVRFLGVSWLDEQFLAHHSSFDQAADLVRRTLLAFPTKEIFWGYRQSGLLLPQLPNVRQTLPLIDFLHAADGSPRRLYYGVIPSELKAGTLGIAYVGRWAGVGHVPPDPKTVPGRHTHTHELAHNLGRDHSIHRSLGPNASGKYHGACGEVITLDTTPDFPNWFTVDGDKRPTLGPMDQGPQELVFGLDLDSMTVADPNTTFDLMCYCRHPRLEFWPSDWTYSNLLFSIDSRFFEAAGTAAAANLAGDYFVVRGNIDLAVGTVELFPFATLLQTEPPEPPPVGDYLLRLRNAGGTLLNEISFEPTPTAADGPDPSLGSFLIAVPLDPAIRSVEIVRDGEIVASRAASASAPTVQVTSPNGGENLTGPNVDLQWTGNDTDGDPLTYVVQYSPDNGVSWTTLGVDLTETSVQIPRSSLAASTQGRLRVQASDGFLTAFDSSNGVFTVANNPPFVALGDPDDGRLFVGGQLVFLEALSFDPEDGNLADSQLSWSSSLDGALGTDNNFSVKASDLTPGTHVITVTATDAQGAQATDTATIRIATEAAGPLADLTVTILSQADPVPPGSSAVYTMTASNNGPDGATGVEVEISVALDPEGAGGPGPATIQSAAGPGWNCTTGSGTANCTRAAMAALDEFPITVQAAAPQVGVLSASAEISGAEEDPATGNDQAQHTTDVAVPPADISVTKTHGPPTPLAGHDLTYAIKVTNDGPADATGVTADDTLPAGLTFVSATPSQGGCTGTSAIHCDLGSLSAGSQATVTIVARPTAAGSVSNTVTSASDQPDPSPGNNQDTDTATVAVNDGPFGLRIAQVFGGSEAAPDAQFVMLQMWAGGQTVGGHAITVEDSDGTPIGAYTFPAPTVLANSAGQDTVLIATSEAQALFNVTADLTMAPFTAGGGARFCWAGTADCVSVGSFTAPSTGSGDPFPVFERVGLALTRRLDLAGGAGTLDPLDDTNDSIGDFLLALPAPRNNARQNGTLPASTCGNNTLEGLEDCDRGDTQSGDGCSSLCYRELDTIEPSALAADAAAGPSSNGNGVLEPGETATLAASWSNTAAAPAELAGAAALFNGPAGATYSILDGVSIYGEIPAGETAACADCFQLRVSAVGAQPAARPSTHWDASIEEVVTGGGRTRRPLHVGDSFTDVARSYLFYRRVETVLHHGITVGCTTTQYCPNDKVRRDQMGIFLARAIAEGAANIPVSGTVGASPYNCTLGGTSLFTDVAPTDSTCRAIHYIASQNVTGGCGGGAFCVSSNVTRAEMALFVARGLVAPAGGAAVPLTYGPDPVTNRSYSCDAGSPDLFFTDITTADSYCKHVHYLWAKGIVSGCSASQYCVAGDVTRGEMARFLSTAFAPNLYGP
jgi:uncharacterized repeat protein (TIGR01451 family)